MDSGKVVEERVNGKNLRNVVATLIRERPNIIYTTSHGIRACQFRRNPRTET